MYSPHELNYIAKEKLALEIKDTARERLYRQAIRQRNNSGKWVEKLANALSQIGEHLKASAA